MSETKAENASEEDEDDEEEEEDEEEEDQRGVLAAPHWQRILNSLGFPESVIHEILERKWDYRTFLRWQNDFALDFAHGNPLEDHGFTHFNQTMASCLHDVAMYLQHNTMTPSDANITYAMDAALLSSFDLEEFQQGHPRIIDATTPAARIGARCMVNDTDMFVLQTEHGIKDVQDILDKYQSLMTGELDGVSYGAQTNLATAAKYIQHHPNTTPDTVNVTTVMNWFMEQKGMSSRAEFFAAP